MYAGALSFLILTVVDAIVGLRASADDEEVGEGGGTRVGGHVSDASRMGRVGSEGGSG